jgi:hypothetical protein
LRKLIFIFVFMLPVAANAETLSVSDVAGLLSAVEQANPGDDIQVASGTYRIAQNISLNRPGPITIKGANSAVLEFDAVEGFKVNAPDWTFDNLTIRGVCANDSDCEHAFHIVGAADRTVIRNSRIVNFNAQIKGNGNGQVPGTYPNDVLIEFNEFYDEAQRQTSNPVTKIDVVGGRRWIIRRNYFHDFAKGQGNGVSYAAFLKGNSRDGLFDANLVVCSRDHDGATRLGLSFGGGGTAPDSVCEDQTCTPEHQNGVMRNNIIANCSDVGIYINKGKDVRIINNTLIGTTGIDVRFAESTAVVSNNIVEGRIRERDGGSATQSNNLDQLSPVDFFADALNLNFAAVDVTVLLDAGRAEMVEFDYCAKTRDAVLDIGAIEYSVGSACDARTPFHDGTPSPSDIDVSDDVGTQPDAGVDGGSQNPDTGSQPGADMDVIATDGGTTNGSNTGSGSTDDGCNSVGGLMGFWVLAVVFGFRRKRQYIQRAS